MKPRLTRRRLERYLKYLERCLRAHSDHSEYIQRENQTIKIIRQWLKRFAEDE